MKRILCISLLLLPGCFVTEECGRIVALYRNADALGATAYSMEVEGRPEPVLIPGHEARRVEVGDSVCFYVGSGKIGVDSLRIVQ